jgi:hypothetical protein
MVDEATAPRRSSPPSSRQPNRQPLPREEELGRQLQGELWAYDFAVRTTAEAAMQVGTFLLRAKDHIPPGRFWA